MDATESKPRKPRVAPHNNSSQVLDCLCPVRGIRDLQKRQGIQPVNHAKLNIQAIRRQSETNKLRKETHSTCAHQPRRRNLNIPQSSDTSSVSGSSANGRDFVVANIVNASKPRRKSAAGDKGSSSYLRKPDFGKVPAYLQQRKLELAEKHAAAQAAKEAALIPHGMRMMTDEERMEMLAVLDKNKAEVDAKIQALPFLIETPSQIRYRDSLYKRAKEIEEALRLFSRPKVLINIDS